MSGFDSKSDTNSCRCEFGVELCERDAGDKVMYASLNNPAENSSTGVTLALNGESFKDDTFSTQPNKTTISQDVEVKRASHDRVQGLQNDQSDMDKKPKRKIPLSICVTHTHFIAVANVAKRIGWKVVREEDPWNIFWSDSVQGVEFYKEMKRFQKVNHFPGMAEICRKDLLARNLSRMQKLFPVEYNIFPKTWCFPADLGDAIAYSRQRKNKFFILKPDQGAQGRGIWLTKNLQDIKVSERFICQIYIHKPLLVDGYKFDLRVYTLITSVDPLRIFVYNEGLARFATSKYKEPTGDNTTNIFMHLTNYSVNKRSDSYSQDDEAGSKRKISALNRTLSLKGVDVKLLWSNIDDIIIKTVLSAWSNLKHNYQACFPSHDVIQACFEILGFDILVDSKLKPYVLEVNHSPSFHTDAQIDREVKEALIRDTFNILNISNIDKRKIMNEDKNRVVSRLLQKISAKEQQEINSCTNELDVKLPFSHTSHQIAWEESHLGDFRRILPVAQDPNKYAVFLILQNQSSIYSDTAASKQRREAARQLRNSLNRKALDTSKTKVPRLPKLRSDTVKPKKRKKAKKIWSQKWTLGDIISGTQERERVTLLTERGEIIKNCGLLEKLFESFYLHNILSNSDLTANKELYEKLAEEQVLEDQSSADNKEIVGCKTNCLEHKKSCFYGMENFSSKSAEKSLSSFICTSQLTTEFPHMKERINRKYSELQRK